jgi:DNA-binding MarR family transcriptional regulator
MSTSSGDGDPAGGDNQTRRVVNDRDLEALGYILREDGVAQSELWKELDVSSRTGSRVARRLAEAGLIDRDQTTHESRQTYWLTATDTGTTVVHDGADEPQDLSNRAASAADLTDQSGGSGGQSADGSKSAGDRRSIQQGAVADVLDTPAAVRGAVVQYLCEHAPTDVSRVTAGVPSDRETVRTVIEELAATDVVDVTSEQ